MKIHALKTIKTDKYEMIDTLRAQGVKTIEGWFNTSLTVYTDKVMITTKENYLA